MLSLRVTHDATANCNIIRGCPELVPEQIAASLRAAALICSLAFGSSVTFVFKVYYRFSCPVSRMHARCYALWHHISLHIRTWPSYRLPLRFFVAFHIIMALAIVHYTWPIVQCAYQVQIIYSGLELNSNARSHLVSHVA
eukprot:810150-Pleurochrysis_carterae.AAC.1